jgi:hypothetical protein
MIDLRFTNAAGSLPTVALASRKVNHRENAVFSVVISSSLSNASRYFNV